MQGLSAATWAEHERTVWGVAMRIVRNPADAEDIAQETFVKALQHQPDDGRPLRPWLVTVARNLARDRLRARGRAEKMAVGLAVESAPSETLVALRAGARRLFEQMARLSPAQRQVVVLRDLLDHTGAETAAALGLSNASVRTHHSKGRRRLQEHGEGSANEGVGLLLAWLTERDLPGLPVRDEGDSGADDPVVALSGVLEAHLTLLRLALQVCEERESSSLLTGRAYLARGQVLARLSRTEEAAEDLERAAGLAAEVGDVRTERRALSALAWTVGIRGDPSAVARYGERLLELATGEPSLAAMAHIRLAAVARQAAHFRAAGEHLCAAVDLLGEGVSVRTRYWLATEQASLAIFEDRLDYASTVLADQLALTEHIGDPVLRAGTLNNLCVVETARRELDQARACGEQALRLARRAGATLLEARARGNLAGVALAGGDFVAARAGFARSLELHRAGGSVRDAARSRYYLGILAHIDARHADAAEHLDAAAKAFARTLPAMEFMARAHRAVNAVEAGLEGETPSDLAAPSDPDECVVHALAEACEALIYGGTVETARVALEQHADGIAAHDDALPMSLVLRALMERADAVSP